MTDEPIATDVFGRLLKAAAANPEELADLCRDYLAEARRTLANLQAALVQKDSGRFRDRAHYLRGSSLVVGASALARLCGALEQMGRDAQLYDAAPLLDQASQALDAVQAELVRRIGQSVVPVEDSVA